MSVVLLLLLLLLAVGPAGWGVCAFEDGGSGGSGGEMARRLVLVGRSRRGRCERAVGWGWL